MAVHASKIDAPIPEDRLDCMDLGKRDFFELRDYLGLHWQKKSAASSIYELRPRRIQLGLINIIEQARSLLWHIDSHRCRQGSSGPS